MQVKLYNLIKIYNDEIIPNVKNKRKLLKFELSKMAYFRLMEYTLTHNLYDGGKYNIFLIYRPKMRVIMSQNIYDKTINHYITRYILEPRLSKYLNNCNAATRKNMGTSYALNLLKKYIGLNKKYNTFYFLKLDIKKYFYNIDHTVLKNKIVNHLSKEEYDLVCKIIDSTDKGYVNQKIEELDYNYNLPRYEKNRGLPIGNLSSQFLAIYYLSDLHHFIIHNLHVKHLIVYMDDYILISNDKEYLKYCLDIIEKKINSEYKLELNKNKTYIKSSSEGVTFLGYHFKVINKKTIITLTSDVKLRIRKNMRHKKSLYDKNQIDFKNLFASINTIKNCYIFTNNNYQKRVLDKIWRK